MRSKFADNPSYVEYESLLKDLHRLIAEGKCDSEEADMVRDEMDRPERELTGEEMARLNGLSADLYMLSGEEIGEPYEGTQEQLRASLRQARSNHDSEGILSLLRKGPKFIRAAGVAALRAEAYQQLGHLDSALLFAQYAALLQPDEPLFQVMILNLLILLNRYEEATTQAAGYIRTHELPSLALAA